MRDDEKILLWNIILLKSVQKLEPILPFKDLLLELNSSKGTFLKREGKLG